MTVIAVQFTLEDIFMPEFFDEIKRYLRRQQNAAVTAKNLRLSRKEWDRVFAGIFSEGNSRITIIESWDI